MTQPKLLNLGCGPRVHPDWVNVDFVSARKEVIGHDLTRGICFDDRSFDAVYHSHVLEHFPKDAAPAFIRECFRVLKPGGVLRVVVPDLEGIAKAYLASLEDARRGDARAEANYDWMMIEMLDQLVRSSSGGEMASYLSHPSLPNEDFVAERIGTDIQDAIRQESRAPVSPARAAKQGLMKIRNSVLGTFFGRHYAAYALGRFRMSGEPHQWMYDDFSLGRQLWQAGFERIEAASATSSRIPDFERYGFDINKDKPRGRSSLFMEACRPEAARA